MSAPSEKVLQAYKALNKYVPEKAWYPLVCLISTAPLLIKVVKPRASKLGDYRPKWQKSGKPLITLNADLNPFAFTITLVHELAHHHTYLKYGNKVAPHGSEWKQIYKEMAYKYVMHPDIFPPDILAALQQYFTATFASSCADPELYKVLAKHNKNQENKLFLEELLEGEWFVINGRTFQKGPKRRTRFMCTELNSNKKYLVNAVSSVQKLNLSS